LNDVFKIFMKALREGGIAEFIDSGASEIASVSILGDCIPPIEARCAAFI